MQERAHLAGKELKMLRKDGINGQKSMPRFRCNNRIAGRKWADNKHDKEIDASFVTTSVNVFEIWYGKEKQEGVEEFINQIENINITKEIGIKTAEILKELKKKGLLVEFRDVFIASACIINNIELLTNNRKHFERIKSFGLKLIWFKKSTF